MYNFLQRCSYNRQFGHLAAILDAILDSYKVNDEKQRDLLKYRNITNITRLNICPCFFSGYDGLAIWKKKIILAAVLNTILEL